VNFRLIVQGQNLKANPDQLRSNLAFGPNIKVGFVIEAAPLVSVKRFESLVQPANRDPVFQKLQRAKS
jgi:hypothetical protein